MERWSEGEAYERYVGRWSRPVARSFLAWLAAPDGAHWIDVGCGTGALVEEVLRRARPAEVLGVDASGAYVAFARRALTDEHARFAVADARALPTEGSLFDVAISGLVLNFVPEPHRMIAEMARVVRPGGVIAAYVWDYAGEMQLIRRFWDAAIALDPGAAARDEGTRFPICRPEALAALFGDQGLASVDTIALDVPTIFSGFDDYWEPFLGAQGPAPGYCAELDPERRDALRERLRSTLPTERDGRIELVARAWAVRGVRPERAQA